MLNKPDRVAEIMAKLKKGSSEGKMSEGVDQEDDFEDEEQPEVSEELMECCKDMIRALKANDPEALAMALKDFLDCR